MHSSLIPYENLNRLNSRFESGFKKRIATFFKNGQYILGAEVAAFEKKFAAYCGTNYCIGVASGLDALTLSLLAFEFPPKSEILVPSNTFIATILAIINAGHVPILVEPDIETYLIDGLLMESKITSKTKALIIVHLYGQVVDVSVISRLVSKYDIAIIEDGAQAHGAQLNGQKVGSIGTIGAFSFYPTKNLGALGDGGAIVTSDRVLYKRIKALRNYGSEQKYYNKFIGLNSRLDEIQAAFLNEKLPYLDQMNSYKSKLAGIYDRLLTNQVIKPKYRNDHSNVYHIYPIRTDKRDELQAYLKTKNIITEIHYPVAPHQQEGYAHYFENLVFPISEEIHSTVLSLPISYAITEDEVGRVVAAVNQFYN